MNKAKLKCLLNLIVIPVICIFLLNLSQADGKQRTLYFLTRSCYKNFCFIFIFFLKAARRVKPRGPGCRYMMKDYNEGDPIITNEPCLNCTCSESVLKCNLKVCPYEKNLNSDCQLVPVPGQCCPKIECDDRKFRMIKMNKLNLKEIKKI